MKNMFPILLAGLIAGCFVSSASAASGAPQDATPTGPPPPAEQTVQPPNPATTPAAAAPAAPAARTSYANMTAGTADQGLILNLRGVTVDQALNFLTEKAGFTIIRQTSTAIAGTVDVVSDDPMSKEEIVALFNKVLASHGLTAIQDKKTLTIETVEEAAGQRGHHGQRRHQLV